MTDVVYGFAMVLTLVAAVALFVAWDAIGSKSGRFTDDEQLRTAPLPPPPPPAIPRTANVGQASYKKPQEMLALPRGDQ